MKIGWRFSLVWLLGLFILSTAFAQTETSTAGKLFVVSERYRDDFLPEGKSGLIDGAGQLIAPLTAESISALDPEGTFFAVEKRTDAYENHVTAFTFVDGHGKRLGPEVLRHGKFSEGLVAVEIPGKNWGFMDRTGNLIIPPVCLYNGVWSGPVEDFMCFKGGWAAVNVPGQSFTIYIDHNGQPALALNKIADLSGGYNFEGPYAPVSIFSSAQGNSLSTLTKYIDRTGKLLDRSQRDAALIEKFHPAETAPAKWAVSKIESFDSGDAGQNHIVTITRNNTPYATGVFGVDTRNWTLFPCTQLQWIDGHRFAGMTAEGKWGLYSASAAVFAPDAWDALDASADKDGWHAAKRDGKWGFIDDSGKLILPLQWDDARGFHEGRAAVCKDGRWGYIDLAGKPVIEPAYVRAEAFHNGLARVVTRTFTLPATEDQRALGHSDKLYWEVAYINPGGNIVWKSGLPEAPKPKPAPDATTDDKTPAAIDTGEYVSVTGSVQQPARIPFHQGMTVMEAIKKAGGLNDYASKRITIHSKDGKKTKISLEAIANGQEPDTVLHAGDTLIVPIGM